MRRLLLLRHGKAERSEPGQEDRSRALIERGRQDARRIGAYMASHGFVPERVMLSPALRTRATYEAAAGALPRKPAVTESERLYGASAQALLAAIKEAPASAHTLLVVAHNPGLHEFALALVASGDVETRERLREKLPTCGLVILDFAFDDWAALHAQSARLERFVSPKMLAAAAN